MNSTILALSRANARELWRDRRTAFATIVLPLFFLAILVGISLVTGDDVASSVGGILPVATVFGLGSVCFFGTVSPTVDLRQRGTLRLLGTTPLSRSTFLAALAPVRIMIAIVMIAVVAAIAGWAGALDISRLPLFLVSSALGVAFLLGIGFVLAGILPNVEAANNVLGLLLVVLVVMGGGMVPLEAFGPAAQSVLEWLPPARLVESLHATLTGATDSFGLATSWGVVAAGAVVTTLLAGATFRWDDADT